MKQQQSGTTKQANYRQETNTDIYDPFGIYSAVQKATARPIWWRSAGAKLIDWVVFFVAFLPLPLILLSSILIFIPELSIWIRFLASAFLLWAGLFLIHQFRLFELKKDVSMGSRSECLGSKGSVVVIGAGPVGLAVVKECLTEGLDVQCFEQNDGIGGLFRTYGKNFLGSCPTVQLTSSPWITAYSDFPPNSSSSKHQTAQGYLSYLESYVEHFGFSDCLNFRKKVINAEPDEKNGWVLSIIDCDSGKIEHHRCDRLAICVGTHHNPNSIDLPGLDSFTGEVFHSSQCNNPYNFKGKSVVIVGAGESGVDIASQIANAGGKTYLSIRRGKLIIPRINPLTNMANDYDTNRIRNAPPIVLRNCFMTFKRRLCFHKGEHTPESALRAQLVEQSNTGPISQTVTKSDDFIHALLEGKLELRKNLVKLEYNEVIFEDGIRHRADTVIFAHGYSPSFPFLKRPESLQNCHPGNLYLNMFHPEIGDSLAFCGFIRPAIGAIPPTGKYKLAYLLKWRLGNACFQSRKSWHKTSFGLKRRIKMLFPFSLSPMW